MVNPRVGYQWLKCTRRQCGYLYLFGWIKNNGHYTKTSPKMVNPREAGNTREACDFLSLCFIIIIIAFIGTIWDLLQSSHCAVNCLQHVRSSGPGTIVCKSRATHSALVKCNMSCYALLSLTESKSHLFELDFIGWTINWWRRGGNRGTQRTPLATSFTAFVECCSWHRRPDVAVYCVKPMLI